jgi:hypothetical protein
MALNAHDYATSNPELGWIEDGLVENCHDLVGISANTGFFCRILAGAWTDWKEGMEVQQSDTVVSEGRLYRVQAEPDGKVYRSVTRPTHKSGAAVLDGINWGVVQDDVTYTAGVRRVTFRDIHLEKPRVGFSVHFDIGKYSRSYYPGAPIPLQEQLVFENCRVTNDAGRLFLRVNTPIDTISILNCSLNNNPIGISARDGLTDYGATSINLVGCVFNYDGEMTVLENLVPGRVITYKTSGSMVSKAGFRAKINAGGRQAPHRFGSSGLVGLFHACVGCAPAAASRWILLGRTERSTPRCFADPLGLQSAYAVRTAVPHVCRHGFRQRRSRCDQPVRAVQMVL